MTHRIFYGIDFKLTDYDKKMFSRKGYECKDLLQGRAGLPVVVPTYEDVMDFCRDRFTRLDGKAV